MEKAKTVRALMHRGLITCRPDTVLGTVAQLLITQHIHALVVADRDQRPLGIISDFDLLAGEWLSTDAASLAVMRQMTAGELMTTPPDVIKADRPAAEAAEMMRRLRVNRLVVEEGGKLTGIISISDIVAGMVRQRVLERRTVADVMSRAMLACRPETPLHAVARAMTDAHYRSVVVLDLDGKPIGVVSGQDMLLASMGANGDELTAADAMHALLTIEPTANLRQAADMMIEHHYHRLVVVASGGQDRLPLGVVSTFDIVNEMAQPGSVWQA
jgi:CBS domain-containing protein